MTGVACWLVLLSVVVIVVGLGCEDETCNQATVGNGGGVTAPRKYTADDLVCAVITTKKYHSTRAKAVKDTWAKRCGTTLFVSADPDPSLPTTVFPGTEEGTIINEKVFQMFSYVWNNHGDKKWFIKCDDDTYLVIDNILALLNERYDHNAPLYIGRAGEFHGIDYCGGGAGYILSQALLREWAPHIPQCQRLRVGEDVSVGKCINDFHKIHPIWHTGFYHQTPEFFLTTDQGQKDHPEGITTKPLSFHTVTPGLMHELDYLLYYVIHPLTPTEEDNKGTKWAQDPWPPSHPTH
ncbi:glycoprotein-N-acetylgalactosamine 3-beta-galactosyltransferase 1 [Pelomyxa schiedti]|nr:glycoprotein-N-acetylgalactosamine 3-beta-galactosyltransferase 1 [Pelomyxa schiedti]